MVLESKAPCLKEYCGPAAAIAVALPTFSALPATELTVPSELTITVSPLEIAPDAVAEKDGAASIPVKAEPSPVYDVAATSPPEPYITALELTTVFAVDPSSRLSSAAVDVTSLS